MKQTAIEWIEQKIVERIVRINPHDTIVIQTQGETLIELFEQAKAMEKEQVRDAFVECWKANVPDGVECKLDAEQYYNETFKTE